MMTTPANTHSESWWYQQRWGGFRTGSTRVRISWDSGYATAMLYDAGVACTVHGFVQVLPLSVPVVHVAWSGEMVMGTETYDFGPRHAENEVRLVQPGDVTWDPKFGELCFTYGTAECKLPSGPNTVVVFGAIEAGLDAFAHFCRRRRFEGMGLLRVDEEKDL